MKYQIVRTAPDGRMESHIYADLIELLEGVLDMDGSAFIKLRGYSRMGGVLRPELQNQPEFSGLLGPMWGGHDEEGTPIVRYETPAVYQVLST